MLILENLLLLHTRLKVRMKKFKFIRFVIYDIFAICELVVSGIRIYTYMIIFYKYDFFVFLVVHTGGGQYAEPHDAVDLPVRVNQTPTAQQVTPRQTRCISGVRRGDRVDGGCGHLGAAVRAAGPSADRGHAVDAVLRGLLRGRRVRRAVGRRCVQPAGRQQDAVHHVTQGGRGPRSIATAHALNDG